MLSQTLYNMELEQLVQEDSDVVPRLQPNSSNSSLSVVESCVSNVEETKPSCESSAQTLVGFVALCEGQSGNDTQLNSSCVLRECLSSRSIISFDEESDTNSVVYNRGGQGDSPVNDAEGAEDSTPAEVREVVDQSVEAEKEGKEEKKEGKTEQGEQTGEKEEATPISQDFVEDYQTRLHAGEKKESEGKKSVSMGTRLKSVWNRINDGEEEEKKEKKGEKKEKKKKEGEEKVSKFSMLLPMGKGKKESNETPEKPTSVAETSGSSEKEEGKVGGSETDVQTAKKGKWEIDQRKVRRRV